MTGEKIHIGGNKIRCGWVGNKPHFIPYHDKEWGIPVHDDHRHFEMLILEGAQAGLSWSTILLRREGYRKAFAGFDPEKVARFNTRKQTTLLKDTGIIRNRLKIKSAITNAKAFLKVQEEFGSFDAYIWKFVGGKSKVNHWKNMSEVPATTKESDALSKDLKKRGFSFVGSTVMYAHMQAAGLVNDHTIDCFRHPSHSISRSKRKKFTKQPTSALTHIPGTMRLKRVYEAPASEDGCRVLVDRLWPRGLSKEAAALDLWAPDVAPSTPLRKWFNHDPSRWEEFTRRYSLELDQQEQAVARLRKMAKERTLTLLFSASDQEWNNAVALKFYLEQTTN